MIGVKFGIDKFAKKLTNAVKYGQGFVEAVAMGKTEFNHRVGLAAIEALNDYLDSLSVLRPESLSHVYEPGMLGKADGRLFEFYIANAVEVIVIEGRFLESVVPPVHGGEPFRDRAEVMESGTTITIKPKNSDVLVFEDDGELVFTQATVTVEHPGGLMAEKGFADAVHGFFTSYATKELLGPVMAKLSNPIEFKQNFARGGEIGYTMGLKAGHDYMKRASNDFI